MAKFTDAQVVTLKGYFDAGDMPTEAQFDALIDAIQQGIEEHDHDATGDGDGMKLDWDSVWTDAVHTHGSAAEGGVALGPLNSLTMADDAWIGIGAALERIVFDAAGYVYVKGAKFGVNTETPSKQLSVAVTANDDGVHIQNTLTAAGSYTNMGFEFGGAGQTGQVIARKPDAASVKTSMELRIHTGAAWKTAVLNEDGDFVIETLAGANQAVGADATGKLYVPHASDRKLKSNIKPLTEGLDAILALQPVMFDWNKEALAKVKLDFSGCGRQVGLIAQDVKQVIPLAASDGEKYEAYDQRVIIPYLIGAIQEIDTRLTKLEAK